MLTNKISKKLDPKEAYELLIKDIDLVRYKRVIDHSVYVGTLAGRIAEKLGLDVEYAVSLGYIHDIGRKIDSKNHVIVGYRFLEANGYSDYSFVCLTHSFLNNDINCVAGHPLAKDAIEYDFLKEYVTNHKNTLYDKIIQICDLLCKDSGFATLEDRLNDIQSRRGVTDNCAYHKQIAEKQMAELEALMGCTIYSLY
jgi:putative nucleotidyltransferase with HDIG domain